jgi:AraC family transcriptional regulator, transcriptional activator FtrA
VSHDDGTFHVDGGPEVLAQDGFELVVVPSLWGRGPQAVASHPRMIAALASLPPRVLLAGFCSGVYLLAAAGRLSGRRATTHWLLGEGLARRYPDIQLDLTANLTQDGDVICSGGSLAAIDGCLHAVGQLAGRDMVKALSQMLVTDVRRGPQTRFTPPVGVRRHHDEEVHQVQQRIEASHAETLSLQMLAQQVHMTVRTLQRRFRAATGITPLAYQQNVRLDVAKDLLAETRTPVGEIAARVGYQDRVAFGRLFKKHTGMTPAAYRQQQGRAV